ncbi:hypothetical protein CR970_03510 [Candidatus Saccharibacteria bacterium]|nr:MAG: hypothetical protein CR970_03510 [Candidatus Saccharibacteria bacterium]
MRKGRQQVGDISSQAEQHFDRHFSRRISNLVDVRRFVASWVVLMTLLIGFLVYQLIALPTQHEGFRPVSGGIYTEGIVGSFTNANPLYVATPVDSAVSRLLFGSLLKYDSAGRLTGDLAVRWSVDEEGKTYKVVLREGLQWHDGAPLTADDVAFTYKTIQNPDAKSPFFAAWQGVDVQVRDDRTILFTLPNVLASFPHALTNGIVPKHLLADTPAGQLRSIKFDTVNPVGSGPFRWEAIEVTGERPETRQTQIALIPFVNYHGGMPQLDRFRIHTFNDTETMVASFKDKEITAMSGLSAVPSELEGQENVVDYDIPYMGEVGVFFRTSAELLGDAKVRQALTHSIAHKDVVDILPYPAAAARSPLLKFHLGYNQDIQQLSFDMAKAVELLDGAGWTVGEDGLRQKDGKKLTLNLLTQASDEFEAVAASLREQWATVGVQVVVHTLPDEDLQRAVKQREYDMLLYGIAVGADPDVFAYWHSSQADAVSSNKLNFSDYKSDVSDKALEDGRTRTDPELRTQKYKPFLEAWRDDAPALMLYQPRYIYISNDRVGGFYVRLLNTSTDRYATVEQWTIRKLQAP